VNEQEEPKNAEIKEADQVEPQSLEQTQVQDQEAASERVDHELQAEKRGRLVTAGLVAAAILSAIAVLVAAVFQLTSRWLIVCPTDLPVNDPAPILWKEMISEKGNQASLGIPEKISQQVKFKNLQVEDKSQ